MKNYRRKLLAAGLRRPDSFFHWLSEKRRVKRNKLRRTSVGKWRNQRLGAGEFIAKLYGSGGLPPEEVDLASRFYRDLAIKANALYGYDGQGRAPSIIEEEDALILYSMCRLARPRVVIETGVSDGVSSAMFLAALGRNGYGTLLSIDFPLVGMPRVYGKRAGWVIPDELRSRWNLFSGKSRRLLNTILQPQDRIDLFFHDSEHSYANMYTELLTAASLGKPGTILLVDDAFENDALLDVAHEISVDESQITFSIQGLGGLRILDI